MQRKLAELKAAFISALCVIVVAQIVMGLIAPLIPLIAAGLILTVIVGIVYIRNTRL